MRKRWLELVTYSGRVGRESFGENKKTLFSSSPTHLSLGVRVVQARARIRAVIVLASLPFLTPALDRVVQVGPARPIQRARVHGDRPMGVK